ncbi:hypothetical protein EXN66_Car009397 [Channa argus]|uniref:Uncharacterized protein n=1 Tax=Channa argus TaxID=215402 RepID=A0A6G1PTR0_CHAAH|nr:hypothetical protein EXN66_Car009397 [Channa argus]
MLPCSLEHSPFKMRQNVKLFCGQKSYIFGKHGHRVLWTKEVRDHPASYQQTVQKPAPLMVCGFISAYGVGSLHIWKGTINAEKDMEVLEQHMFPSRECLFQGRPVIF